MHIVGLTGGIASGKSYAAEYFIKMGARSLNCDVLGHESYKKGSLSYIKIVSTFGSDILDDNDEIDRRSLGPIVFSDSKKMDQLTSITWPAIKDLIRIKLNDFNVDDPNSIIMLEAAVLLEAGWDDLVDEILVIYAPVESVIKRIKSRDNIDENQAKDRINSQLSNEQRLKSANSSIENAGELVDFQNNLDSYWSDLKLKLSETLGKQ
ncbi:MAG: dephospho-CoA kinase [Dehalococcoidia bacterium]|nr:dephospho-CoA kinase [Dehalococcoidia bacterium]